jgi:hypothetical protein
MDDPDFEFRQSKGFFSLLQNVQTGSGYWGSFIRDKVARA